MAQGKVQVMLAIRALQVALGNLGVMSEDGRVALDAMSKLIKHFGKSEENSQSLMPAEVMQLMQRQTGPGAAPPAAAPGGAPPGAAPQAPPMAA